MDRILLTHSLLSSWLYALKGNPYEDATTERDPMSEFMATLRRDPTPTTEAMQRGIDFENLVTDIVVGRISGTMQPISLRQMCAAACCNIGPKSRLRCRVSRCCSMAVWTA